MSALPGISEVLMIAEIRETLLNDVDQQHSL
jgi:hypothetical protein